MSNRNFKPGDVLVVGNGVPINMWDLSTGMWVSFVKLTDRMLAISCLERRLKCDDKQIVVLVNNIIGYVSDTQVKKLY